MREISREVDLATDIFDDAQLQEQMQRSLDTDRVRDSLSGYLEHQEDRFFSSVVVAAVGGEPVWRPFSELVGREEGDPAFPHLFRDNVGALAFVDEPRYYALDGQHRVSAIKARVQDAGPADNGFLTEVLSVIVVVPEDKLGPGRTWQQRYRRLFTSLNRWGEKTTADTNIVMDEDDRFAILTRRLISKHAFFKAAGKEKESYRVKSPGKSMKEGTPHFVPLQVLYEMNRRLLTCSTRLQQGWPKPGPIGKKVKGSDALFLQRRPEDAELDRNWMELKTIWDAIIRAIPELGDDPRARRDHAAPERDHLLFWPIGQMLLADVVRDLLDCRQTSRDELDVEEMKATLKPLGCVEWRLHRAPWRYVLLTGPHGEGAEWRMRNEDRARAIALAKRLVVWLVTGEGEGKTLESDWRELLYPMPRASEADRCWSEILEQRRRTGGEAG